MTNPKPILFSVILALSFYQLNAQASIIWQGDTINRVDVNGGRQGLWQFADNAAGVKIAMHFKNDIAGDTIRYFENNLLRLVYIKSKTDTSRYIYYDAKFMCTGLFTRTAIDYCSNDKSTNEQIKKFILYEIYPVYYGSRTAIGEYLGEKVQSFPPDQTGTVKVGFTLDKTGKPTEVKINSSENEKLNSYCIRAIQEMPRWQAGFQGGAVVTVPMVLPIICK